MKELTEKRTDCQKVFQEKDKTIYVVGSQPIHYRKNDEWVDYPRKIVGNSVLYRTYRASLLKDGLVGYKGETESGESLYLELKGAKFSKPEIDGRAALYKNVFEDTDFKLVFEKEKIFAFIIVNTEFAPKSFEYILDKKDKVNRGWDNEGRSIDLEVTPTDNGIIQSYRPKVLVIDEHTRIRSWSNDVKYPIILDPTTTFDITNYVNNGSIANVMATSSTVISRHNNTNFRAGDFNSYGQSKSRYGYLLFKVDGIPQETEITSAILRLNVRVSHPSGNSEDTAKRMVIRLYSGGSNTVLPTNLLPDSQTDYQNLISNVNFTKVHSALPTWPSDVETEVDFDVTEKVQTLLNSFDYTDTTDMLFSIKSNYYLYYDSYSFNGSFLTVQGGPDSDGPLLIIQTGGEGGGGEDPDPMKITFD